MICTYFHLLVDNAGDVVQVPNERSKQLLYNKHITNKQLYVLVKRRCDMDTHYSLIISSHTHWPPLVFLIMKILYLPKWYYRFYPREVFTNGPVWLVLHLANTTVLYTSDSTKILAISWSQKHCPVLHRTAAGRCMMHKTPCTVRRIAGAMSSIVVFSRVFVIPVECITVD
jgi:hypothetical protein